MDPNVYGNLLTLHRRGNGVDVEAIRDRIPLRQITGEGPKMGTGTKGCRGGKVVFVALPDVSRVYPTKIYTSVMIRVCHSRSRFLSCMYIHEKFMTESR